MKADPDVDREILRVDRHRALAQLLRDVEALQVARADVDGDLVVEVEVEPTGGIPGEGSLIPAAQVLADLVLAMVSSGTDAA